MPRLSRYAPVLLVLAAGLAGAAPAAAKDVNRDRIPDRWEKRHHLSLKVSQARRDQDRDGLRNLGEYRAGLNPRQADTDGDGIEDGDENAGTIASSSRGILTIRLAGGGKLSGAVTERTELECEDDAAAARASRVPEEPEDLDDLDDLDETDVEDADEEDGDDEGTEEDEEDAENEEDGEADEDRCTTDDLVAGTRVHEATLRVRSGRATFRGVELGGSGA